MSTYWCASCRKEISSTSTFPFCAQCWKQKTTYSCGICGKKLNNPGEMCFECGQKNKWKLINTKRGKTMKDDSNCVICHGTGKYPAKCITCRATGDVYDYGSKQNQTCPDCNGTKEKLNDCQKSVWQKQKQINLKGSFLWLIMMICSDVLQTHGQKRKLKSISSLNVRGVMGKSINGILKQTSMQLPVAKNFVFHVWSKEIDSRYDKSSKEWDVAQNLKEPRFARGF